MSNSVTGLPSSFIFKDLCDKKPLSVIFFDASANIYIKSEISLNSASFIT